MEFKLVNSDERGEIQVAEVDGISYWLSYTRKGFGRGGDIHEGWQYNAILKGSFTVYLKPLDGDEMRTYRAPMVVTMPPEMPHVFIALEDSYMIEWHDHELPPFSKKRYYEPYRRLCK